MRIEPAANANISTSCIHQTSWFYFREHFINTLSIDVFDGHRNYVQIKKKNDDVTTRLIGVF